MKLEGALTVARSLISNGSGAEPTFDRSNRKHSARVEFELLGASSQIGNKASHDFITSFGTSVKMRAVIGIVLATLVALLVFGVVLASVAGDIQTLGWWWLAWPGLIASVAAGSWLWREYR